MAKHPNVSLSVIRRLPKYYRFLEGLSEKNIERISSKDFAESIGVTASQIRQDLNCFGGFGQQGYGYNVKNLHSVIGEILGLNELKDTIIVGAGNLGLALANNMTFNAKSYNVAAIFDSDPKKIGTQIGDIQVWDVAKMKDYCRQNCPEVAVLCVPDSSAERVVKELIEAGVKGFWNFSHYDISLEYPKGIAVEDVNLTDTLMTLSFRVSELDD